MSAAVGCGVLGLLSWTVLEYNVHRYVFHNKPSAQVSKSTVARRHHRHHLDPDTFPTWNKRIALVAIAWTLLTTVLSVVAGFRAASAYSGGFVAGYVTYTWFHERIHKVAPTTWLGRRLRWHHLYHHFEDSSKNHGVVTGPMWDMIFGTAVLQGSGQKIRVPRSRYPISWLSDEAGNIPDEYSSEYVDTTMSARDRVVASSSS